MGTVRPVVHAAGIVAEQDPEQVDVGRRPQPGSASTLAELPVVLPRLCPVCADGGAPVPGPFLPLIDPGRSCDAFG